MKINKIVKYAGLGLMATAIVAGVSFKLYDNKFDYTKSISPLESILGPEYQIKKIEEAGYMAKYSEGYEVPKDYVLAEQNGKMVGILKVIPAEYDYNSDGIVDYIDIPEGFTYDGKYIEKTVDANKYKQYIIYDSNNTQVNHLYKKY